MRIVSPNPEASLAAVRRLSESAINNPPSKNIIVPFVERAAKPASGYELPELPEPRPEKATAHLLTVLS